MIKSKSFNPDYSGSVPQASGTFSKALRISAPTRPANEFTGMVLIMCVIVLLLFASACVTNRSLVQQVASDAYIHINPDSLTNFPQELFGIWLADDPDYVEPNGWEEWYRNIEILYWDGNLLIQYGSLVGGIVSAVEYDGETCIVEVNTEFGEYASYYFRLQGDKMLVKAPEIIVNEPDKYKAYHRFVVDWPEEEDYDSQDICISANIDQYGRDTTTTDEKAVIPTAVVATQDSAATNAMIDWSEAVRSVLSVEAENQGWTFLDYSLYRLQVGEEGNPDAWTLVATLNEPNYSDPAWYSVPFGVYKYAVANNYSNNFQGEPVFSNELQRRNFCYFEDFNHSGDDPEEWYATHEGSTFVPWGLVQDGNENYSYFVGNPLPGTAKEILYSSSYNCSRYEKVFVSFWHKYVHDPNSKARFQYSLNGIDWKTLLNLTCASDSGFKAFDISASAKHQPDLCFRWIYIATSQNNTIWNIDDFAVYGYTPIPVYLGNTYTPDSSKVNSQTVELGISYIDDDLIDTVAPSAIAGFKIEAASCNSVTLSWLPVTEEHFAAYEIYYDTHRDVGLDSKKWSVQEDAALGSINTTGTTINKLDSGVNYWFRIRAVDLHGNVSEFSEQLPCMCSELPSVTPSGTTEKP